MTVSKQIKDSTEEIRKMMQFNLSMIANSMVSQIMGKANALPESKRLDATKDISSKGINAYKSDLRAAIAAVSSIALDGARKEVPKASKVKLMENEERLLFGEFEKLPANIRKRINASNDKIIGTQISDLEKNLFFTFDSATRKKLGLSETEFELNESSGMYVSGNAVRGAASVSAANTVNEVRNAFFFEDEVLEQIEAFEFMNNTPQNRTAICEDLVGTIFAKNDPNHFRYTPPLHYNCRSWIRPILKLKKNQEITKLKPSTAKIEETIQFDESPKTCSCGQAIID